MEVMHMKRTQLLQEIRKMRFEEAYDGWTQKRLTQAEAARLLGVCERTFRRCINRYEDNGLDGLADLRLGRISHRRAPADEVISVTQQYRRHHLGWNVKHFYGWYRKGGGGRSYTWVKQRLQEAGLVRKTLRKAKHRSRRSPMPLPGMMIHQDASTHQWVAGKRWDLVVTMDDATNEHYEMVFVHQEGTASSFQGVKAVIESKGLFCSFYSDRGSHYWHTPEAGGKVDKNNLTQFGRAMKQLGIQMIAAYSPQARGRSERAFKTHQGRLPQELALAGIESIDSANQYLKDVYRPAFNKEFVQPAMEAGSAFVGYLADNLEDILCEHFDRQVGNDNCVKFKGLSLQIPPNRYRMHYVKAKVQVHYYNNGKMAIFHGPRKLADYDEKGHLLVSAHKQAA
jgi:transposase